MNNLPEKFQLTEQDKTNWELYKKYYIEGD